MGTKVVVGNDHSVEPSQPEGSWSETIGDIVTGIPAPLRKRFYDACGRLMTAAVDWPAAVLEGWGAERRAETSARIKIIEVSAEQIAERLQVDPEFVHIAAIKSAERIAREQINLNRVAEVAARQLTCDAPHAPDTSEVNELPPIDEDWINNFEAAARLKSSDDMHSLFGKLLSAEIRHPSSFSIRTVNLVSELSQQAAQAFQEFCSLSISVGQLGTTDVRVCSLGGRAGSNSLQGFGLPFNRLNLLQEHGLLVTDYECWFEYICAPEVNGQIIDVPFYHQRMPWALRAVTSNQGLRKVKITGPTLSRAGRELFRIVDLKECTEYTAALKEYFRRQGLDMVLMQDEISRQASAAR